MKEQMIAEIEQKMLGHLDNAQHNYKKKWHRIFFRMRMRRQHQDEEVIAKLKSNIPMTSTDIQKLEKILWNDLGSKEDYEKEYG